MKNMKKVLIPALSMWSVLSVIIFAVTVYDNVQNKLLGSVLLLGFVINLVCIFIGALCLILDILFNSHIDRFSRTFGIMTFVAFISSTVISFIPAIKGTVIYSTAVNLLWFTAIFLLVYVIVRKTNNEEKTENGTKK